ncbi:hypothetical protein [Vibrio alginolyticus]|uniref:hypothetical protein n=1 Tax=Vibrio alginolyticus TaxID=663 RepID=UPI0006CA750C|nr:hypothetical protein [Vibrio alginolyticus]KPM98739.1 hypothetical protein AOG25_10080 [Vibrio alginolyticus]CAH7345120.1 conserved hypothetical protein [Vibrio chagasii]
MNTNSIETTALDASSAMEIAEKSAVAGHIFGVVLVAIIFWMVVKKLYQCLRGETSFTHKFIWLLFGGAFAFCLGLSLLRITYESIHIVIYYLS